MTRDWQKWHRAYDDESEDNPLRRRLAIVQGHIGSALDHAPPGRIRVISMCAGEGRDILGVLETHPRAADVTGCLVELDPALAATARTAAPDGIEVRTGDASMTRSYAEAVPADVVIACGVFGNIADTDIEKTIATLPMFCAPDATVIWTRHRRPPDMTVAIRRWLADARFEHIAFDAPDDALFSVGVHRFTGTTEAFDPDVTMFEFVGYDTFYDTVPERCDECGYEYERDARDDLARVIRRDTELWRARLATVDDEGMHHRPAPDVWSPLEYACHVRDVLRVQRDRIDLALTTDAPDFAPMRRDERAIEERYNEQDVMSVAQELQDAAEALAGMLGSLDDGGWHRTGLYNYPTKQLRTVEWIVRHTIHELEHHLRDIQRT